MKTPFKVLLLVSLAIIIAAAGVAADTGKPPSPLPASLDNLYPPKATGPIYFMAMHEMAAPMSGMVSDMFEQDMANAQANYEKFKQEYIKISKMVPEWENYYPMAPVEKLGIALKSGDPGQVMAAVETVGKTCDGCHLTYMPLAYLKYHGGDFTGLTATDPVTKQDMPYTAFMQIIEGDMTGIGNDLGQNQPEAAREHAAALAVRMGALREVCDGCHETERAYYVDPKIMGLIDQLQASLQGQPNPQEIGQLLQGIGTESCFKCHLVHIPGAYARRAN